MQARYGAWRTSPTLSQPNGRRRGRPRAAAPLSLNPIPYNGLRVRTPQNFTPAPIRTVRPSMKTRGSFTGTQSGTPSEFVSSPR